MEKNAPGKTGADPDCGACGGTGWVTVNYDGMQRKEKCPLCAD
ncbi:MULTISPECIES: hypothetical protein [Streptomyces]|nr:MULTISPECIES: hypothetical protein [Streptomyces]